MHSGESFGEALEIPRFIRRNRPFHQSANEVAILHNHGPKIWWLRRHDWFHALARLPTWKSGVLLLGIWTLMIILFAGIYMGFDRRNPELNCGLGIENEPIEFGAAFAFSLETCTTVGYGLPSGTNAFFESCQGIQTAIYFQMVWSMMFNAFLFAFFFTSLGRCDARGAQVLFSDKAVMSIIDGTPRFQVRLFDVDSSHPIVEAHVRMYAVMKDRPVPRPLRMLQPDDELGAMLLMSFPTVVCHQIDIYSMLHPRGKGYRMPLNPSGLTLREADSRTANREDNICRICGEAYGTHDRWLKHVKFQKIVEEKDGYPTEGTHLSILEDEMRPPRKATSYDLLRMKAHFENNVSELIVVVEGIEPILSGTFQALQSYRYEDIVWNANAAYTPCLFVHEKTVRVDLDLFHSIHEREEQSPENLDDAMFQSQRAHDSMMDPSVHMNGNSSEK